MGEMHRRHLESQLEKAEQRSASHRHMATELKRLQKQLAAKHTEYAPDGTPLGQDIPDFEDTPDAHDAAENAHDVAVIAHAATGPDDAAAPPAFLRTMDDGELSASLRLATAESPPPAKPRPQSAAPRGSQQQMPKTRSGPQVRGRGV